jgi:hypothetical protein
MSKFLKRFQKVLPVSNNALVVCTGFGYIEDILLLYNNVFLIDDGTIQLNHKKLIRRQSFSDLTDLCKIDTIFLDLDQKDKLVKLRPILSRDQCYIVAQGETAITGDETAPLVQFKYKCISANSLFHIWKKI